MKHFKNFSPVLKYHDYEHTIIKNNLITLNHNTDNFIENNICLLINVLNSHKQLVKVDLQAI